MRIGADVEPCKGSIQIDTVTLPATVCKDWMIKGATGHVLTTVIAIDKQHTDNKEHTPLKSLAIARFALAVCDACQRGRRAPL